MIRLSRTRHRMYATWLLPCLLFALAAACERPAEPGTGAGNGAAHDTTGAAANSSALRVSRSAGLERVSELVRDPRRDSLPADTVLASMIRLGYDIMRDTRTHAREYTGNSLSCANCHLNAGQKEAAWPLVGVATLFPQYRSRTGRLITLEDRIRDCFERSMNGTAPPFGSTTTLAVSAYLAWISAGLPAGEEPAWRGANTIASDDLLAIDKLDVAAGKASYERTCAACHGLDGQGVPLGAVQAGPLWGDNSWNDGAGAARVYTLAGFIRHAMPLTAPGSINDTDAQNIAAYINAQERPSYARKDEDFVRARVPVDAVYYPQRYSTHPLRR